MLTPSYLQHLNESNTQVEISLIAADQAQTEEKAYGKDCSQIDFSSHLNSLAAVQQRCCSGQDLGHEAGKSHMPRGKNNRCDTLEITVFAQRIATHTEFWTS